MKKVATKCIVTLGEHNTNVKFTDEVSGVNMLNATIAIMQEAQFHTGMKYKEIFAIVDEGLGAGVFRKKPTMSASKSETTASEDGF